MRRDIQAGVYKKGDKDAMLEQIVMLAADEPFYHVAKLSIDNSVFLTQGKADTKQKLKLTDEENDLTAFLPSEKWKALS